MAQKLNNKLNYQPRDDQEEEEELTEETHHKYEEELEINDFPQQARSGTAVALALARPQFTVSLSSPLICLFLFYLYSKH